MLEYSFFSAAFFEQDYCYAYFHDTDGTFRSAVFYFLHSEPSVILTDSLDVGNPTGERIRTFISLVPRTPANKSG